MFEVIGFYLQEGNTQGVFVFGWQVEYSNVVRLGKKVKTTTDSYTRGAGSGTLLLYDAWNHDDIALATLSSERHNMHATTRRTVQLIRPVRSLEASTQTSPL